MYKKIFVRDCYTDNKCGSWIRYLILKIMPCYPNNSIPSIICLTPYPPVSTVTVSDRTRMRVGKTIPLPEFSGVDMNIKQFQLRERILDETFRKQKD